MKARTKQAIRCHHVPSHALIHPRTERLGLGKSTFIVFIDFTQIESGYCSDMFRQFQWLATDEGNQESQPGSTITAYWIIHLCQDPVLFEWSCTENTSTSCWTRAIFWQFCDLLAMKARTKQAIRCHHVPFHALIHPRNECLGLGKSTLIVFIDFTQIDSGYCSDMFRQFQWLATDEGNQESQLALLSRLLYYHCVLNHTFVSRPSSVWVKLYRKHVHFMLDPC